MKPIVVKQLIITAVSLLALGESVIAQTGPISGGGSSTTTAASVATACAATNNQILWVSGSTCTGLTSATSSVLVTSATGTPSISNILPSLTQTGLQSFSGQILSIAGTPTIGSGNCGVTTNGTVVAGSTNQSGQITIGVNAATTCIINFSTTITAPHACVVTPMNAKGATVTTLMFAAAPTTTQFSITGAVLASTNWQYICL